MDIKSQAYLLGKCTVGVGASYLAALFSTGWDEVFKEIAVLGGILVSMLTILNLMWSLMDKIHNSVGKKNSPPVTVNQVIEMAGDTIPANEEALKNKHII